LSSEAEQNFGRLDTLLLAVAALAGESLIAAEQAIDGFAAGCPFSAKQRRVAVTDCRCS
jgi:hypothetical protein